MEGVAALRMLKEKRINITLQTVTLYTLHCCYNSQVSICRDRGGSTSPGLLFTSGGHSLDSAE